MSPCTAEGVWEGAGSQVEARSGRVVPPLVHHRVNKTYLPLEEQHQLLLQAAGMETRPWLFPTFPLY